MPGRRVSARPSLIAASTAKKHRTNQAVSLVEKLVQYYKDHAKPRERMGKTIERLGLTHMEEALDLGWKTLAECFAPEQLLMKQALVDKYFPKDANGAVAAE